MAVTVINQPTTPNATKTKLVYTISGSNVNQPQYQYVTDIFVSGSNDLLTRLYTYPNLTGNGIVDVARVLDDNLEFDNYWQITGSIAPQESVKTFDIRFGEAFGTSISSSVTIFTGSSANFIKVFPGIVDPNEGSFNFNTSSFSQLTENSYLTNNPAAQTGTEESLPNKTYAYLINSTDYLTLTVFQDLFITPGRIGITAQKVENGVATVVTSSFIDLSPLSASFNTIGVGPQNLADLDAGYANFFASGSINALNTKNDPGGIAIYINDLWDGIPRTSGGFANISLNGLKQPLKQCSDEYTRFAFINNYGFWDYYNIYNPTRKVTNVERNIYDQNYVDYSSNTSIYSYEKLGKTQYNTGYTDTFEITTDYVDGPISTWLTELFDSPDVYIQDKGVFIPVVIINSAYEWNMNENRQKLFQYTIQYQYANKRQDI